MAVAFTYPGNLIRCFHLNICSPEPQRSAISYDAICQNKPVIEFSPEGVINKASPLFSPLWGTGLMK